MGAYAHAYRTYRPLGSQKRGIFVDVVGCAGVRRGLEHARMVPVLQIVLQLRVTARRRCGVRVGGPLDWIGFIVPVRTSVAPLDWIRLNISWRGVRDATWGWRWSIHARLRCGKRRRREGMGRSACVSAITARLSRVVRWRVIADFSWCGAEGEER